MQRALGTKNKLGFINGNIPVLDHLVQSWLINSLSESIAQTVVFYDSALEIWHDLH